MVNWTTSASKKWQLISSYLNSWQKSLSATPINRNAQLWYTHNDIYSINKLAIKLNLCTYSNINIRKLDTYRKSHPSNAEMGLISLWDFTCNGDGQTSSGKSKIGFQTLILCQWQLDCSYTWIDSRDFEYIHNANHGFIITTEPALLHPTTADSLNLGWNVEQLFSGTEAADLFQFVLAVCTSKIIQTMMNLPAWQRV